MREVSDAPTRKERWQFTASRVGALVVAAASYVIAFGLGIYTSIEHFGEGASTQPYSRDADIKLWSLIVVAGLVFVIAIPFLGGSAWRPWWTWPRWTRRAPLSRSTYLACISVYVLSVYASVGIGWLIEVIAEPVSVVDTSTAASRPPAAEVLAALRAGFSEEVFASSRSRSPRWRCGYVPPGRA